MPHAAVPGELMSGGRRLVLGAAALAAAAILPAGGASAQEGGSGGDGVFPDSIVFGQSAALNGPAEELGRNMNLGIRAAFEEANRAGGVNGRVLRLLVRDDGYEPEAAVANTRELIAHGVFGLIGAVGTPTSRAAEPAASDEAVPYIGAFTGAELLRADTQRYVVNLRASYYQETEEMVERLVRDLGFGRIAVFYQDDSYGLAGLTGVRMAMDKRGMELVSEAAYMRNTLAVKRGLLDIRAGAPEAVIIIGAYAPVAHFIRWARKIGLDAVFVNISFVGSSALLSELGRAGDGVVVTQVVPFPGDTSRPAVARYQAALRAVDPDARPGFVSLEGYLAGRLVVEALEAGDPETPPTRESFLRTLTESGSIDLGGFVVSYGEGDNQGSDLVFLTVIRGGEFVPVTRLSR
ncbi:ABC transporter substrate-binding protein [Candidatus Palauibacter sp.]|uniref:ABC transporter substrate-binding protein n=1 Tax=Candidatus Palauibacter sp. TaxID=3101350 RepID=UPI003AF2C706